MISANISRRTKVLWLSESPLIASGFGRVSREIASRLARVPGMEVACLGWGHDGWPYEASEFPVRIYPAPTGGYGKETFERVVSEFQPDVVISLAEVWMTDWMHGHPCRGRFKWVGYIPLDSGPFYPPWIPMIQGLDGVVAMSEFGREVLRRAVPSKSIDFIPHGVDIETFRPLPDRAALKSHDRLHSKFVVGCVARNQPRKNIPALIKAFASLISSNPNLHLYLHTSPCDVGHDLLSLLHRYGLEGHADICPPEFSMDRGLSDEQLNRVYNFCDITVLPSMGEGFGLPIIESFAAGVPVVATDYSACRELVSGRGELARVGAMITMGSNIMEYAVVDSDDLASCIDRLSKTPDAVRQYSAAARAFAVTLAWDRLLPRWVEVIQQV